MAALTVLGTGKVGAAIARTLLQAGLEVVIWNRTPRSSDALKASGASAAASVVDAIAGSRLILMCVSDYDAVRSVLNSPGAPGKLAGSTLVSFTTVRADETEELRDWLTRAGARFIAAGILTHPGRIGKDDARILYAGDSVAFDEHRKILDRLAGRPEYMGTDPTACANLFAAVGMYIVGALTLFLELSATVRAFGLPVDVYARLAEEAGEVVRGKINEYAPRIMQAQFGVGDVSTDITQRFVHDVRQQFIASGLHTPVVDAIQDLLDQALAAGRGSSELAVLSEVLLEKSKPEVRRVDH